MTQKPKNSPSQTNGKVNFFIKDMKRSEENKFDSKK